MGLLVRILHLGRRSRMQREIDAELQEHLQMCIDDNIARGMSQEQAERDARLRFGSPTVMRERVSAEDAALGLDRLWNDMRAAIRVFTKNPGFSLVVVATLALGIGANTAIFELLDAVRLRVLPIRKPQELAELRIVGGNHGLGVKDGPFADFTIPMWQEIKAHHEPFSHVFAWRTNGVMFGSPNDFRRVQGLEVSGDFFNALGIVPWQGRLIEPQDETDCHLSKVVASYAFWKSEMGGKPITATTTILAEGRSVQVLGVTPPSFFGMIVGERFDLAYPTCTPAQPRREVFLFSVMGRLKPDWTLRQASEYFNALSPGLFENAAPEGYSASALASFQALRLGAYPAGVGVSNLRNEYNSSLQILLAITGLVLLIACANLANLMLARASVKRREIAVRMALGASRKRLLQQAFLESALLAICGAVCGVVLAQPLAQALLRSLNTSHNSIHLVIAMDWRVLLFAAGTGVLTCVLFGTLPAMRSASTAPIGSMKSGERGIVGNRERFSVQRAMVITQVAVSMVLLVGALLFVRSYRNLLTLNPGMREHGITIGYFNFPAMKLKTEEIASYKRQLLEEVRAVPGVENAAATNNIPLSGSSWGHEVVVGSKEGPSKFSYVSPSYFETMGIPLLTGRNFTDRDTNDAPLVLIVNQRFLREFVTAPSPLGQLVHVKPEPQYPERTYEIVGTVPDTKYDDLRGDRPPIAFVPAAQLPVPAQGQGMAILFASADRVAAERAVRRSFEQKHPGMILQFDDFEQGIQDSLVGERMMARVSGFFGVLATLLVVVGLYGVLSYFLAQRRGEIGIRIALGAGRGRVIANMLRDATLMLLIGLVTGAILAILAERQVSTLLFGLKASDPIALAGAALLLAAVTIIASLLPALRAAQVNPIESLRAE